VSSTLVLKAGRSPRTCWIWRDQDQVDGQDRAAPAQADPFEEADLRQRLDDGVDEVGGEKRHQKRRQDSPERDDEAYDDGNKDQEDDQATAPLDRLEPLLHERLHRGAL
jgi:hypothetical protein